MIYADLHLHTAYSDGLHSIDEVVRFAKEKGIKTIAITDHDTVFHHDKIQKICEEIGMESIRAVEMSCYDFDVNKKVHIIGIGFNKRPHNTAELCEATLTAREKYHRKLIEELNEKGLEFTYEDAKKYAPYNIVFKIHLFQAIGLKYPEYLNNIEKYKALFASKTSLETDLAMGYIDVKVGIDAIHKDGGIAILAHPCEYKNYDEVEKYVNFGLDGIEISHPLMKEVDYELTLELANKYGLIKTGGSDFHYDKLSMIGKHGLNEVEYQEFKDVIEEGAKVK